MFLQHYSLREQPFGVTPDPRFFYPSASHREALASLIYALESRLGFAALIAEPGMGKTTVLRTVVAEFREKADFAFLFDVHPACTDLLPAILADFELPMGSDPLERSAQLKRMLVTSASAGRLVFVLVDEAQNLTAQALESLRLLSNFETDSTKLLQIVVAGQPRLRELLSSPELRQLRQRIPMGLWIAPLSTSETASYIQHRLHVAGYTGAPFFTDDAVALIASQSRGVPREINALCFNALSLGYALRKRIIDSRLMEEVLCDMDWNRHGESEKKPPAGAAFAAVAPTISVPGPTVSSAAVMPAPTPPSVHVSSSGAPSDHPQLSADAADPEASSYRRKCTLLAMSAVLVLLAAVVLYLGSQRLRANEQQRPSSPPHLAETAVQPVDVTAERSTPGSTAKEEVLQPLTRGPRGDATRRTTIIRHSLPYANGVRGNSSASGEPRVSERTAAQPGQRIDARILKSASPARDAPATFSVDLNQAREQGSNQPGGSARVELPASQHITFPSMPDVAIAEPRVPTVSLAEEPSNLIYQVPPVYPRTAQQLSLEGNVFLEVHIGRDGTVLNVRVVNGNSILAQAAAQAVYRWKYRAATLGGVPVESTTQVLISFHLRGN
jgi:general secretion pathway protein A